MVYIARDFTAPAAGRYEAELATKTNVTTGSNHPGYTGIEFVDNFATPGGSGVSFVVEAATAGDHTLDIRFGNGGTPATRAVVVDGRYVDRVSFPALGTWDAWVIGGAHHQPRSRPAHGRRVVSARGHRAINVDNLTLTPVSNP